MSQHGFAINRIALPALVALVGIGGLGLTRAASAATVGPYNFDSGSQFTDNFKVRIEDPNRQVQHFNGGFVSIRDAGGNGNNSGYVVLQPNTGSPFNALNLTAQTTVGYDGATGGTRWFGPTLLGATDGSVSYLAGVGEQGEQFAIQRVEWNATDNHSSFDILAETSLEPAVNIDGGINDRIEFDATVDQSAGTATLTARLYAEDGETPTATISAGPRDLSEDGTAAVGEAGFGHTGARNTEGKYGGFRLDYTPVPEPASLALLGLGGAALLAPRRRGRA